MKHFALVARLTAVAVIIGFFTTPAFAADGKPFLIEIGTGEATTAIPSDSNYHTGGSVSFTPKKSGFCAVTASANIVAGDAAGSETVWVTIAQTPDSPGPWYQWHNFANTNYSVGMTQAFTITKDVPATFYWNVANDTGHNVNNEMTRIWAICSAVKDPVLP